MEKSIRKDNLGCRHIDNSTGIECTSCGDDYGNTISERVLFEIIQKGLIQPSDFGRMNDPGFPEEKRVLLRMLLKN